MSFSLCNIIGTFDFSTLFTTITHSKDRLTDLITANGQSRYKYLVIKKTNLTVLFYC